MAIGEQRDPGAARRQWLQIVIAAFSVLALISVSTCSAILVPMGLQAWRSSMQVQVAPVEQRLTQEFKDQLKDAERERKEQVQQITLELARQIDPLASGMQVLQASVVELKAKQDATRDDVGELKAAVQKLQEAQR